MMRRRQRISNLQINQWFPQQLWAWCQKDTGGFSSLWTVRGAATVCRTDTISLGIQQRLSFNKHTFTNLTAAVSSYMKQAVFIQPVRSMCEHVSPTLYRGQRCTRCTSLNMNLGSPKETPHNQDCFRKRVRSKNLLKLTEVLFSLSRVRAASAAHLDHTWRVENSIVAQPAAVSLQCCWVVKLFMQSG